MNIKVLLNSANRNLLAEFVKTDFKLRYQGSVLGYVWSILRPLMLFGVLYVVFTKIVKVGGTLEHYPTYLLFGLVLWQYFTEATVNGMNAITGRADLIRKVRVPKSLLIVSTNLSALVSLGLNMIIVFIFMAIGKVEIMPSIVLLPLLIVELVILCIALAFILATLYVKFRDFGHIWEIALQVLFYATPIIYPFTLVPHKIALLLSLNPLTQIIQDARQVLITPQALTTTEVYGSVLGIILPLLIVLLLCVVAVVYFRKNSPKFAEEL